MLRTLLKALRRTTYAALAILLILFATIQFNQHLLRHRAEALHADILSLQLHPGTFADLQRLQTKWGAYGSYQGECTPHHCNYVIVLDNVGLDFLIRHNAIPPLPLQEVLSRTGVRYINAAAEVRVHDNRMWGADYSLQSEVVPDLLGDQQSYYTLVAALHFGPRLHDGNSFSAPDLTRGYNIGRPGGCTGCISGWVDLTTNAAPSDIRRLNDIDLSCITTWHQCQTESEIMPTAWKEWDQAKPPDEARFRDSHNCSPVKQLAQQSENIALATVLQSTSVQRSETPSLEQLAVVKIDKLLKSDGSTQAESQWKIGRERGDLEDYPLVTSIFARGGIGKQVLLMYEHQSSYTKFLAVNSCFVFATTPDVLAAVLQGIADDSSIGEPYHHDIIFP